METLKKGDVLIFEGFHTLSCRKKLEVVGAGEILVIVKNMNGEEEFYRPSELIDYRKEHEK